ncbi:ABC transporter ATP-binding protein [Zobellella denitrificans]|jgi:ATP-binding cassette subfamily B protein/ATP-binding cassette subfamily C protein/ATP-binding cassette subfamily B multidrug efflux pump|uniref:ABC transporter transmembrane domain-containing protein n=1 Tax=Zobellella denitrificans TaxID=347534 RepID=UPI000B8C3096|nr:ABC transporter transmembrane domain-containing protein [Zobellella denitrificans]OXS14032.1 ABC transporter ATP-binding protein [Zobellella denitrificans]
MKLFRQLAWFFKAHWRTYSLALLMLATVAVMNMSIPYLIGQAVDSLIASPTGEAEGRLLVLILLLGIAIYGLRLGWRWILFGTSYRLGNLLRRRFFELLTRQGQAFYSRHNTGDLMARATNDIDAIEVAAGEGVLSGFDGLLTLLLVLVIIFGVIDWRLSLVALLPFPLMGLAFYRISNRIHHHFKAALEQFSVLNDKAQEAIAGVRLVKSMGREEIESRQFGAIAEAAAERNYQVARAEALYEPVVFLSMSAALLLTLGFGAWLIWHEQLSVGQLTSFTLYLAQLIWPMFAFGWLLNIVERGSAALTRVEALLAVPDSVSDRGRHRPEDAHIRVRELGFHYPEQRQAALSGLSFELAPGRVLGLAGPTGAGKSTLLQLLMRYWETEPGQISIGGHPIADCRLDALRGLFAYVPQDAFLFSASIADNIRLGRPEASQDEVMDAARQACVHDDIAALPRGYDTQVGERGMTLSGGQRQRLAIARALLSRAPILVLDDALSAVDVHTEQQILHQLRGRRDQGCIIVSHRLSALEHADQILVLNHGRRQQAGRHGQLIAQDGWYSRMWAYQQLEAVLDEA